MICYKRDLNELYDDEVTEPRKRLHRNAAITCSFNGSLKACVFISFPSGQKDFSFYRSILSDTFEEHIKRLNYLNQSKKQKWEF